jgi:hypothetical protein
MELCKVAASQRMEAGEEVWEWRHFEEALSVVRFAGSSAEEQVLRESYM